MYDAHYNGARALYDKIDVWEGLQRSIDLEGYAEVLFHQKYQAGHAFVSRDAIVDYYQNLSGIPDDQGRVGNHPYRIEAEHVSLTGLRLVFCGAVGDRSQRHRHRAPHERLSSDGYDEARCTTRYARARSELLRLGRWCVALGGLCR